MRRSELMLLLSYLLNNEMRLSSDLRQAQSNLRYRSISDIDCFELIVLSVRAQTFKEVSNDIRELLKIEDDQVQSVLEYLSKNF